MTTKIEMNPLLTKLLKNPTCPKPAITMADLQIECVIQIQSVTKKKTCKNSLLWDSFMMILLFLMAAGFIIAFIAVLYFLFGWLV